jgi:hypothetical protein
MPNDKDKDELLTTPLQDARRTTPHRTPPASGETPPDLPDGSLRALRQRYDILAELGRGGMGIVYRARDRETGDVVALKVLRPEIAARPEVIERFKSELLLARKITHKNVCRTYELLRFGDTVVIAMEYVEGESLRSLLGRVEGLSVRQGLKILRQIIAGLAEAHAQGVVHRDLKPENILITRDGGVKVMDFGIARSIEAEATQTSSIVGTPAYMSPEQAEGKPVDARTDIYALGLILYEIFTGRLPFHADTRVGLVHKQIHETPPPARSVDPYLPIFLDRAIEKCLEKNPKKRFQSVAELEAALEEQAIPELPEGEPVPASHLLIWRKRDWALLALGVIGLLYFLAYRNTVFPVATKPLEVDAITARRVAEDLASRLGMRFDSISSVQLRFRGEQYRNELVAMTMGPSRKRDAHEALALVELPLYWEIAFGYVPDALRGLFGKDEDQYVIVDRKGRIEEFSHPGVAGWPAPAYHPPSVEQRRTVAQKVFELACGALPPDVTLIETAGGEQGAFYKATWRPLRPAGASPVGEVSLLTEQAVSVKCRLPGVVPMPAVIMNMLGLGAQFFSRVVTLALLVVVMVFFGIAQCHRLPILLKRSPLAVTLGLAGAWVLAPAFTELPNTGAAGTSPSLPILLAGGLAAAGLILVGIVTAEHYLVRRTPGLIASYVMAWRGCFTDRAVGLAIVRGALAGLILGAIETLLFHLSLAIPGGGNKLGVVIGLFFSPFMDPAPVGQAVASFSPALFVISAAVLNGVMVGLVFLGLHWGISGHRDFAKHAKHKVDRFLVLLGVGGNTVMLVIAFRLQFGQALGTFGFLLVPFALLLVATWVLLAYDILTVIVAVATAVLWTLNHPLLQILQEVGNGGQWAVFMGWSVLVAAAAAVAFRAELVRAVQRARAEIQ